MNAYRRGERETRETAETLAISALSFLAGRPDDLGRFLALSGVGPENLRASAADPGFLAGVVDHLLGDESLLLAFAGEAGVKPERVAAAARLLAEGGGNGHDPAVA